MKKATAFFLGGFLLVSVGLLTAMQTSPTLAPTSVNATVLPIGGVNAGAFLNGFTGGDVLAGPGVLGSGPTDGPYRLLDYNGSTPINATLCVQMLGDASAIFSNGTTTLFIGGPGLGLAETFQLQPGNAVEVVGNGGGNAVQFVWVIYKAP